MIIKRDDGTYSGDYVFKGDLRITREKLEKGLVRIKTFLSLDSLNGEILYVQNLRDRYKSNKIKFFQVMMTGTALIHIYSVEIIDDEDNIGLRIVFKPKFYGVENEEIKDHVIRWIDTNQMCLLPRMVGSKHGKTIDHIDIITFDLVPKENTDINIDEIVRKG